MVLLLALLRCDFMSALTLMSPTLLFIFTIHPFFAPKIADAINLYVHKVLQTLIITSIISMNY